MIENFARKAFGAAAFAAAVMLAGTGAHATPNNGTPVTINLSGSVGIVCSVANVAGTTAFNDLSSAVPATTIGTITETCNDPSGYQVTLTSANFSGSSANFKGGTTSALIPYSLTYGGNNVAFASATTTITTVASLTGNTVQTPKALVLSAVAHPNAVADNYADLLTVTMAAN